MEYIQTDKTPTPGNYSQAVIIDIGRGQLIYTAGQTGNIPSILNKDEPVIEGGIGPQTTQALKNLEAVLNSVGAGADHIIKTTVFLEDLDNDKPTFEKAYKSFFESRGVTRLPARSTVGVTRVPLATESTCVEIEAVAYLPKTLRIKVE